jgi:hypothetical protein
MTDGWEVSDERSIEELKELKELQGRDQDGVDGLHDIEAEAGDESELDDSYDLDFNEAHALGVDLDRLGGETPRLD